MAEAASSDVDTVSKLKRRLHDAAHRQKEAVTVLKVLNRLSLTHMTLEILKVTHIGKEVNSLRKWNGEVGDKAKALVKKWKQLLPDSENSSSSSAGTPSGSGSSLSAVVNGRDDTTAHHQQHHGHKNNKKEDRLEDGDVRLHVQVGVPSSQRSSTHLGAMAVSTDGLAGTSESDIFSRALMADPSVPSSSVSSKRRTREVTDSNDKTFTSPAHKHKHKHKHKNKKGSNSKTTDGLSSFLDNTPLHDFTTALHTPLSSPSIAARHQSSTSSISSLTQPKSPPSGSFLDIPSLPGGPSYSPKSEDTSAASGNSRKRKANLESTIDSVALTKRSRTQVYSGKRSMSGPQAVPSLFDQSMRVLIDNIDDIGEVGGVPYFILEPVLQKCTPTQLMRLEEYNEHFLEDTEPLWEKHCLKEFKGCKPKGGQSWRDLYIERLAQREQKLKNLAATIKAKEMARQEPVRKAMLADVSRMPIRRGRSKVSTNSGTGFRGSAPLRGRRFDEDQSSSTASRLKKQTMKMAKQMHQMKVYKPGRR